MSTVNHLGVTNLGISTEGTENSGLLYTVSIKEIFVFKSSFTNSLKCNNKQDSSFIYKEEKKKKKYIVKNNQLITCYWQ